MAQQFTLSAAAHSPAKVGEPGRLGSGQLEEGGRGVEGEVGFKDRVR